MNSDLMNGGQCDFSNAMCTARCYIEGLLQWLNWMVGYSSSKCDIDQFLESTFLLSHLSLTFCYSVLCFGTFPQCRGMRALSALREWKS